MSLENFWNEVTLYFHYEFIDSPEFPESKKNLLQNDAGTYFINKDFTIYQEKAYPENEINETDQDINFGTFLRILYHLPPIKVNDLLEFHLDKFKGEKLDFINHIYYEFKGSTYSQGDKILPDPQQKVILQKWCENKSAELNGRLISKPIKLKKAFINLNRIEVLKKIESENFDLKKLLQLLEEINMNYELENFYSVAMLGRAVIDHIPPIFGFKSFNEVSSNYGSKSFKGNMENLNKSMKNIADNYLHSHIRNRESLPNENQIDFSRDFDVLLGEIIVKLET